MLSLVSSVSIFLILSQQIVCVRRSNGAFDFAKFQKNANTETTPKCSLVPILFHVDFVEPLKKFECVGLTGDNFQLGNWKLHHSLSMFPTDNKQSWTLEISLCEDYDVHYRYFIYSLDTLERKQIRYWESYLEPRSFRVCKDRCDRRDRFGETLNFGQHINRGWLTLESIVQFQITRPNQLQFFRRNDNKTNPSSNVGAILVKVVPLDLVSGAPQDVNAARVEVVKMEKGSSKLQPQDSHGILWKPADTIIFHITVAFFYFIAYAVILYSIDREPIGHACIIPAQLEDSNGAVQLLIDSPNKEIHIGQLFLPFLVIRPVPYSTEYEFKTGFSWTNEWHGLDGGYRGLGQSFHSNQPVPFIENTIGSFKAVQNLRADGCIFDVVLTADCVPVIYHSFEFLTTLTDAEPESEKDLVKLCINDLTYEELKRYSVYFVNNNKITKYLSHNAQPDFDLRLFPTLKDYYRLLPKTLGIGIILHYPQKKAKHGSLDSKRFIDKNIFTDAFLEIVQFYGCERPTVLMSSNPDITTMLRFKQNMFPVVFLTLGTKSKFLDKRTRSIEDAINQAQAFELTGIAPNAFDIFEDPRHIQIIRDFGKPAFYWGETINSALRVKFLKDNGATGVIYNRIDLIGPKLNQTANVFSNQASEELFKTQCLQTQHHHYHDHYH